MNCDELKDSIKRLRSLRDQFSRELDASIESKSSLGKRGLLKLINSALEISDEVLEQYLPEFVKKNPEIGYSYEIIGEIKDSRGNNASISSICPLRDGSFLLANEEAGFLYRGNIDQNGKLNLNEQIEQLYNAEYEFITIFFVTPLPDGGALIGGYDGTLYRAVIDENGKLKFSSRIDGFNDNYDNPACAYFAYTLPDDSILIGGFGRYIYNVEAVLYRATIDRGGGLNLDMVTDEANGFKSRSILTSGFCLSKTDLVLGGDDGILYCATMGRDGDLIFKDRIEGFLGADRYSSNINSICPLSDGSILIGGRNGALYRATVDENGKLRLGNRIVAFDGQDAGADDIKSILPLPDGRVVLHVDTYYYANEEDELLQNSTHVGKLYFGVIDQDGMLVFEQSNSLNNVRSISSSLLPDKALLAGTSSGLLYRIAPEFTLKNLKENLGAIVNKQV